jgi:hypothetical protein
LPRFLLRECGQYYLRLHDELLQAQVSPVTREAPVECAFAPASVSCCAPNVIRASYRDEAGMISARVALERLRAGNHRFATNTEDRTRLLSHARRAELAKQQWPFAIVLGCSDSRVPAEIVFDQGLGDPKAPASAAKTRRPSPCGSPVSRPRLVETGCDARFVKPFERLRPSCRTIERSCTVPGSIVHARSAFAVCQVLAWLA